MSFVPQLLLRPLHAGRLRVRNRVVSTAHGAFLDFYRPGERPDRYIAYQERRARGGVGLIVLQPLHVHRSSQGLGHYAYEADDLGPKLAMMARAVHRHGAAVVLQLLHFGAEFRSDANDDLRPLWSFSGTQSPTGAEPSHEMTGTEIGEVIEAYGRAAALATESGLDGVELSATHGYLLQQSFTPAFNQRSDEWGQPLRFLRAVLGTVRAAAGPGAVVGFRISADDFLPVTAGGLGPGGLREIAREIAAEGDIDYLSHSEGSKAAHYARSVANYRHPPGEFLPLTAGLREAIGASVPVIGVGRITTPQLADRALVEGVCDLVGMTRAHIADPDVVVKTAAGRAGRIRPCVGANSGCVDRMVAGLPITCFHNPDVGREYRSGDTAAGGSARVLVVGAGPAGLKAAEAAARLGHSVSVAEAAPEPGGRLRLATHGPARDLLAAVDWLVAELDGLGVTIDFGREVEPGWADGVDAVVLATGARQEPGRLAHDRTDGSVPVISVDYAMTADLGGRRVVIVDQLGTTDVYQAAERLASAGAEVRVRTPMPNLAAHAGFTHIKDLLTRLYGAGCQLDASLAFTGVADGLVAFRQVHSGRLVREPADALVAGIPPVSDTRLAEPLQRAGFPVLVCGDAVAPRSAMHAFREGADAAYALAGLVRQGGGRGARR